MKIFLSICLFLFFSWTLSFEALAQDTRSNDPNAIFEQDPSSRNPESASSEVKGAKKRKKSFHRRNFNQRMDQKVEEFEERMEANAKKYKKRAKQMEKPQYSDPLYFGHKKKPKKRPVGKRKLCKECGIVH